jgi:hypothetical protein
MQQKSAEQGEQRSCQDTERLGRVQCNVTFVAPLETPWGVKPQQPERNPATGSTWRRDVDEDMAAFTAAVDNPGPPSHALPPRTVAEGLSHPDASEWVRAMEEEVQSCLRYGVWKDCALPAGKQA